MNDFYVNIASKIGGDIDVNQTSECNTDFVTKRVNHFSDHPSVTDITNTMKTGYFSFRHTTQTEVEKIMQSLDTKKATGPDRIPAKLIKPAAGTLSHQLTKVFNQCVDNNDFPSDAKLAKRQPKHHELLVQQPSRHFPLNLAKIPPNQVIADFGRGSSVES